MGGVRLDVSTRKGRSDMCGCHGTEGPDPTLVQQTSDVLGLVTCARKVFGGDSTPDRPPAFAAPRDLEEAISNDRF